MPTGTVDKATRDLIRQAEKSLADQFEFVDETALTNQRKVLDAFRDHKLTEEHFAEHTGYGIDDAGREALDAIFAQVFGAPAAAVRMQIVSGTHALALCLYGCLKPGDRLVSMTGTPYDTLQQVIGMAGDGRGSLKELGVLYEQIDIEPVWLNVSEYHASGLDARVAAAKILQLQKLLEPPTRLVTIQKSCGYSFDRSTLSNDEIGKMIALVKVANPQVLVMVDNCYGEFVETTEPTSHGADIIAGSLIKNPGGGLAISGGYIAGRQELIEQALFRLTAPGIGGHQGVSFNQNRLLFQGLFLAPSVVASAVKGAMLAAVVFSDLGLEVKPAPKNRRFDIIQSIKFGDRQKLVNFCRAIQYFSPVNAHVAPEPAGMPGYEDQVVMAGGTFVEGSTIELSADGPLREPYAAFLQGGLTYLHIKCMLEGAITRSRSGELPFV
ncbi:MAG: methionine gamma-lyase family protein [Candidatus Melainabacteria bacterium]|nr:methionine gamma-lyase family protein [Candidatus Melainabacteria bacterium]